MATNTSSSTALTKVVSILRLFRLQNAEMPMQQADVLLTIAGTPGITMTELSKVVGLAQSSTSRNVAGLSNYLKAGQPGLGFIDAVIDPLDPRRRLLYLTPKGQAFVQQLLQVIDPKAEVENVSAAKQRRTATPAPEELASTRKRPANVHVPLMPGRNR